MTIHLRRLNSSHAEFDQQLDSLLSWNDEFDQEVHQSVVEILARVRHEGDTAVLEYTNRFDRLQADSLAELEIPPWHLRKALESIPRTRRHALETAAERIRAYAEHQKLESWQYRDRLGNLLGQQVTPMDRVGLYVPGGKAAYPSSVLMNAVPARVAGVPELIMTVPTPAGEVNDLVLAAAAVAGIDRVFRIGGAQAIAALAYGTETIPRVDKIVGPGNIFVATAKKLVFGQVGIDMIAGPSEILIIADGVTEPDWIAMDLFSQAEHDENAQSILLSPDPQYLEQVADSIERLLPTLERNEVIEKSLQGRGALIRVKDLEEACAIANCIAPEHLELSVADPESLLPNIRHAGAIFLGSYTAEALGDYCAGPNHVLPTSGTARFSSSLGVYDFQKRSTITFCTAEGTPPMAKTAEILALGEGLSAHARSAAYRIKR